MENNDELIGKIIFNKYRPIKRLGEGSFGKIFVGENIKDGLQYALKLETKDSGQSLLETEAYILCYLKGYGIPIVKSYGFSGEYNVLVMELLGPSLENLFQKENKKFSLKTTCMLGIQMIERIEWVHSKNIVHRDIKPDNFVIGRGDKSHIIYILDFGLSKKYWSTHNNSHIKFVINKKLTGTARYASINALRGCEQSRRDDLEAIGYVLLYFLKGVLPWQGLKIEKKDDRYKKIYEKKKSCSPEELCEGCPGEMCEYIKYTRNLEFEGKPDYDYLKGLLKSIMHKNTFEFDYFFDWCTSKPIIKEEFLNNNNINVNEGKIEGLNDNPNNKISNENNKTYQAMMTNEANLNADVKIGDDTHNKNNKKNKNDKKNKKLKIKDNDEKDKSNCIIY